MADVRSCWRTWLDKQRTGGIALKIFHYRSSDFRRKLAAGENAKKDTKRTRSKKRPAKHSRSDVGDYSEEEYLSLDNSDVSTENDSGLLDGDNTELSDDEGEDDDDEEDNPSENEQSEHNGEQSSHSRLPSSSTGKPKPRPIQIHPHSPRYARDTLDGQMEFISCLWENPVYHKVITFLSSHYEDLSEDDVWETAPSWVSWNNRHRFLPEAWHNRMSFRQLLVLFEEVPAELARLDTPSQYRRIQLACLAVGLVARDYKISQEVEPDDELMASDRNPDIPQYILNLPLSFVQVQDGLEECINIVAEFINSQWVSLSPLTNHTNNGP